MKKRVGIILIFILLVLYVFISIIFYSTKNVAIFGKTTIVYYKNNKIDKIKYYDKIKNKYSYELFNVLIDDKFVKAKIILNNNNENEWYQIYDLDYEKLYPYQLIAYKGNINMEGSTKTSDEETELDISNISKIEKENDLNVEKNEYKKIIFDMDNDGNSEIVYYIDYIDIKTNMYCYCIYLYKDNSLLSISTKNYSLEQLTYSEKYDLAGVIDIDLDGKKEILLSSNNGDDTPVYYHFFKYDSKSNSVNEIK